MKKLQFAVGMITLISMVLCVVSLIVTIILDSMAWFGATCFFFTILLCGMVVYNIWELQMKKTTEKVN